MRCVFIYNPVSGRNRDRRTKQLHQVEGALSALGHTVEVVSTTAPGSATIQARDASRRGADIVFACGGDGTVHEVLQGLASEAGEPMAVLGVIPLGSANALARHLKLPLDPRAAALKQIRFTPRSIPIGKVTYGEYFRYFIVMAGAGPDGALVYSFLGAHKSSLGRFAYYLHAARLFVTRRFRIFEVEYTEENSAVTHKCKAVSVIVARVSDLGGIFSRLTDPRNSLGDHCLKLIILRPPASIALPLWFISGWLNLRRWNQFVRTVDAATFSCGTISDSSVHFQADGEWLGKIPMQVSLVPNAIRILSPECQTAQR